MALNSQTDKKKPVNRDSSAKHDQGGSDQSSMTAMANANYGSTQGKETAPKSSDNSMNVDLPQGAPVEVRPEMSKDVVVLDWSASACFRC
jgi:hypothetical protein